jgi:hypothetical protein
MRIVKARGTPYASLPVTKFNDAFAAKSKPA